jgi:hypothetical protein
MREEGWDGGMGHEMGGKMPSVNDHMHATVLDPSMLLSFDGKPNYVVKLDDSRPQSSENRRQNVPNHSSAFRRSGKSRLR